MPRSYGQFCALARALDHVGDRWTLLIVRELLPGPRRFAELQAGLPGVATNLLTDRLRGLAADGLVTKPPGRDSAYELTAAGRELDDAVAALIRWGARWMRSGPGGDAFDARWALVALRALLAGPHPGRGRRVVDVACEAGRIGVHLRAGRRDVGEPAGDRAGAVVSAPGSLLLAIADGALDLRTAVAGGSATVDGDAELAAFALGPVAT